MTKKEKAIIINYEKRAWNELRECEQVYGYDDVITNKVRSEWYAICRLAEKLGLIKL